MTKCGKSFMPECEYFTTGGCVSPFNCPYKIEQEVKTETSIPFNLYPLETDKDKDKEITRLTAENAELTRNTRELFGKIEQLKTENDNLTVEFEVAQRDIDNLTRTLEEANDEIKALEAENAELQATLSKMETVEKELRARLEKAVILPCKVGDSIYQYDHAGKIYESKIKKIIYDTNTIAFDKDAINNSIFLTRSEAEARLAELRGGKE